MSYNNNSVDVTIYAKVSTCVDLAPEETEDDVKNRFVDVYLHGSEGHSDKVDLGADNWRIVTDAGDEMALVNKNLLLALLDTVRRTTDLEHVYNDTAGVGYKLSNVSALIDGLTNEELSSVTGELPSTAEVYLDPLIV